MIRVTTIFVVAAAAAILAGMLVTNPDYNRALRPFIAEPDADGTATTRTVSGKMESWRLANVVEFEKFGTAKRRDTSGVFLIVELRLNARNASMIASATWEGASGRRYRTTNRVSDLPRLLDQVWLQPGLSMTATAIFELPPDEIEGGSLLLGPSLMAPLDGLIRLYPPDTRPTHRMVERMGGE